MSKISQELKALLYLNDKFNRTKWVTIKELAQELEVTDRQARRYLEDLSLLPTVIIDTRLGRDGGYHLRSRGQGESRWDTNDWLRVRAEACVCNRDQWSASYRNRYDKP